MDDEHVLALIEAVHGANRDAVRGFAANAAIVDDVGHLGIPPADFRGQPAPRQRVTSRAKHFFVNGAAEQFERKRNRCQRS
jgi:hypothetical protein